MPSSRRRNSIESAVVLKAARMGEIHRNVALLTPERGVVYATAHGAGKAASKLKAATIPFACVTAYLYHDPVRDSFKVTDVEPRNLHGAIRADLAKFFTASLWVEIVLRSHGGGTEAAPLHALLAASLATLDAAGEAQVGVVSVQVLWRCLQLLGLGPDLECCAGCGRALAPDEELRLAASGEGWCRQCAARGVPGGGLPGGGGLPAVRLRLEPAARRFLLDTAHLRLEQAVRHSFAGSEGLRRVLQQMVQNGLEAPLKSLRCAAGIL